MQAVNDAVDEVSSLLNKFQECAPDLSDPMSAAAYAADELTDAKEGFVRYFSDEEENFYLSYVDPVVVGRQAFHSTNDFVVGVGVNLRDTACAIVDAALDIILGINKGTTDVSFMDPVVVGRHVFSVVNDTVSGAVGDIRDALCAVVDIVLDVTKGTSAIC
ncbi:hypothetical protein EYF80_064913 [Liparis tanakae]|uniref:Uncharacterized protein n=1 Tax=Liparis tanakae TaxID=230148 RepID=A0A4Z2E867_9TELE|nr:hypothetical protein EYF80_064913 [Liparis tanakae]